MTGLDVITIRDLARGNGVADDTLAFNTAIAAAQAAGGGTISVDVGTYKLGSTVTIPSTVTVILQQGCSFTGTGLLTTSGTGQIIDQRGATQPNFNVMAYGARGNGAADDTVAVQNAINAAAIGGGTVYVPPGTYKITSEVTVANNVSITGAGAYVSTLKWGGTNQTTSAILHVQGPNNAPVTGIAFRDFGLDGNNNFTNGQGAGYGLRLVSVQYSLFQNMLIQACGTQCIRTESDTSANNDFKHNLFERITLDICDQPIYLSSVGSARNTCHNLFQQFVVVHGLTGSTNSGIYVGDADNNTFVMFMVSRRAGTGAGVQLGNVGSHGGNTFVHLEPGQGGLTVDAGGIVGDKVFGYQMDNGEPAPVINGVSQLTWTSDGLNSQGWSIQNSGTYTLTISGSLHAFGSVIAAGMTNYAGDGHLIDSGVTLANGAAAQTATLTNAPVAGNPTKWVTINDNGTTRRIPAW